MASEVSGLAGVEVVERDTSWGARLVQSEVYWLELGSTGLLVRWGGCPVSSLHVEKQCSKNRLLGYCITHLPWVFGFLDLL